MRSAIALVLVAVGAMLVVGCKSADKTTGPAQPVKTTPAKPTRSVGAPVRGPVSTAPGSFEIKPQSPAEREKTAATVCDNISAERKKRIEGLVSVLVSASAPATDKVKVAQMLGDLCDPMAVPFLMIRMTAEGNRDVRLACVEALGRISDPSSARAVIELLDDEDLGMATAALNALSEMTDADPPYAFVNGTTVKVRKAEKAKWLKKLDEGYFKTLEKK